jgi:hypothetical protein
MTCKTPTELVVHDLLQNASKENAIRAIAHMIDDVTACRVSLAKMRELRHSYLTMTNDEIGAKLDEMIDDAKGATLVEVDVHELLCDNCIKHTVCMTLSEDCHTYRAIKDQKIYIKTPKG